MFDVGFWELMVVFLVALIVLGPERLPKVARYIGHALGKMRNTLAEIKREIDQEAGGSRRG